MDRGRKLIAFLHRRKNDVSMDVHESGSSMSRVFEVEEARRGSQPQMTTQPSTVHPELRQLYKRLTIHERKALRMTWNRLKGPAGSTRTAAQLMTSILHKTIEKDPQTKKLFVQATFIGGMSKNQSVPSIADHARHLVVFIDRIIAYLNQNAPAKLTGPSAIGESHAYLKSYGLQAKTWDVFGQHFADAIATQESVRVYPHGQKAWNTLIACLTDRMRASFEIKSANRRRSSEQGECGVALLINDEEHENTNLCAAYDRRSVTPDPFMERGLSAAAHKTSTSSVASAEEFRSARERVGSRKSPRKRSSPMPRNRRRSSVPAFHDD